MYWYALCGSCARTTSLHGDLETYLQRGLTDCQEDRKMFKTCD